MKLAAADWLPYALPFKRPWQTSQGAIGERRGRLLRLQSTDGLTGWGDCAPLPEFGIDEAAAESFAEECAQLDLVAQQAGLPLNAWLSGQAPVSRLAVNFGFWPLFAADRSILQKVRDDGFTVIKFKVGGHPLTDEITTLHRLAAQLPPGLSLRLDANRAWSPADAQRFLSACAGLPIDGLEEPLADPDWGSLQRLQASTAFPLAIDESVHLLDAAFFRHPPVRRLVIKPARHGLLASIELALRARTAGLDIIVTSALESACGLLACAQLAAAVAPEAVHGLATADCLAADTGIQPAIIGGRLHLPTTAGLDFLPLAAGDEISRQAAQPARQ